MTKGLSIYFTYTVRILVIHSVLFSRKFGSNHFTIERILTQIPSIDAVLILSENTNKPNEVFASAHDMTQLMIHTKTSLDGYRLKSSSVTKIYVACTRCIAPNQTLYNVHHPVHSLSTLIIV